MKLTSSRAIWERVPGFRNHVAATLVFLGVELRLNLLEMKTQGTGRASWCR